jgi:hypothetical protein
MIEENNERDNKNCAYIFELMTPKICNANSTIYCNNCENNQSKSSTNAPNVDPKNAVVKKGLGIFSVVSIRYSNFKISLKFVCKLKLILN